MLGLADEDGKREEEDVATSVSSSITPLDVPDSLCKAGRFLAVLEGSSGTHGRTFPRTYVTLPSGIFV